MRKLQVFLFAFVASLLLVACGQQQASQTTHSSQTSSSVNTAAVQAFDGRNFDVLPKNKQIPVTFVHHVDGDTSSFRLNNHVIKARYLLIDTPETVKANTPVMPYGMQASNYTHQALNDAQRITIMFDKGDYTDKYHRALVYVFVDGKLLQQQLVEKGLARVAYVFAPSTTYLNALNQAQATARANKLNIWSREGYVTNRGFNPKVFAK
ncbi:thermonuclease family protein [Lacticaseibacillus brantae]|uniref:TNase-like domain-containing protein n=1 Tax=Lacticaseibacillus brantae DSM 23927 TaxID=1423727 RepID=A0A0R2AY43_9LACO|nr:thermonuclease family protein [Lacticaseibacillus brantae]KRM71936.1 hypothetical protein FC34_GL000916 [Lacticaseibacillus brantae DSM 23927]